MPLDLVSGFKQHVTIIIVKSRGKLVQPLNNIT